MSKIVEESLILLFLVYLTAVAGQVSVTDPASKLKAAINRCTTVTPSPVDEWKLCYCKGGGDCLLKHYLFGACIIAHVMIEMDTQTVAQLSADFKTGKPKNEKLTQCPNTSLAVFWSTVVAEVTKASKNFYPKVSTKSSLQQTYEGCFKDQFAAKITKEDVASVTCRKKEEFGDADWTKFRANAFFACFVGFLAIKKPKLTYEGMLDYEMDTFLDKVICGSMEKSAAAAEQRGAMLVRSNDPVGFDTIDENLLIQVQNIDQGVARFFAADAAWQKSVAARLGLTYPITPLATPVEGKLAPGTKLDPAQIQNVKGDGNCFFRSLSFLLTGGDEELLHKPLRKLVRRELMQYYHESYKQQCVDVRKIVDGEKKFGAARDAKECLEASAGDSKSGLWVTEREQFAAASLLNSHIYIYQSQLAQPHNIATYGWHIFNPFRRQLKNGNKDDIEERSVYLNNENGNHFQVVIKATK